MLHLRLFAASLLTAALLLATPVSASIPKTAIDTAAQSTVVVRGDYHEHDVAKLIIRPDAPAGDYSRIREKTVSSMASVLSPTRRIIEPLRKKPEPVPTPTATPDLSPVVIEHEDVDKYDKAFCSGFVAYSQGTTEYVVTARHCTQHIDQTFRITWWGDRVDVSVKIDIVPQTLIFEDGDVGRVQTAWTYRSGAYDVAILKAQSMRAHPYVNLSTHVTRGQNLFVFGMPGGTPWVYQPAVATKGPVYQDTLYVSDQETRDNWPYKYLWPIDCPACGGGDSGAGTFNAYGQVVGLLDAGRDSPQMTLIVPASNIRAVLRSYRPSSTANVDTQNTTNAPLM